MVISIICGSITLISIFLLIIKIKNDKLDLHNAKIIECEKKLQIALEQKFSIISELQPLLATTSDEEEFNLLCNLEEINDDDFMLNAILNKAHRKINTFIEERRAYVPSDEIKNLLNQLYKIDIECIALKEFYNKNTTELNNMIAKFPNNTIAKFKKINKREIYNDPVEEEFEILKKK